MSLCAKKKGFTLVELSIVMAVVIILASVSIVTFTKVIKAAKESAVMQEMKQRKEELMLEDILHTNSDDWLSVDELEEETIFLQIWKPTSIVRWWGAYIMWTTPHIQVLMLRTLPTSGLNIPSAKTHFSRG